MALISGDEAARRLDLLWQQLEMAASDDTVAREQLGMQQHQVRSLWNLLLPDTAPSSQVGAIDPSIRARLAATWDKLPTATRQRLQAHLEIREQSAVLLGPIDPRNPMHRGYPTHRTLYALTTLLALGVLAAVALVWTLLGDEKSAPAHAPTERGVFLTVAFMGLLGGLLHATASIGIWVGGRKLERSWIIYYLMLPLQGAGMAAVLYFVMRMGLDLVLQQNAMHSQLVGIQQLNLPAVYAFAGLAGLFSRQALEMLGSIFSTVFKPVQSGDKAATKSPPPPGSSDARAAG